MASTIARSSSGSREKALSGPGVARESVKCFSTMQAPSATAAAGAAMPIVWSDRPAGSRYRSASSRIPRRFISSGGAGYALVHFNSASPTTPAARAARTASSISSGVAIPVDMIMGLPVRAMRSMSGMSTSSKEATLCTGTSRASR